MEIDWVWCVMIGNKDAALDEIEKLGLPSHPLVLVLDNVRSAYNVGSIFRTAETARVSEVAYNYYFYYYYYYYYYHKSSQWM